MRQDELLAESLEGGLAVVAASELCRGDAEQGADVAAEALGARVVEVVGDGGEDRDTGSAGHATREMQAASARAKPWRVRLMLRRTP